MKNICLFAFAFVGGLLSGCSGDHQADPARQPQLVTPLQRFVDRADLIVYGQVLDERPLNMDNVNRYAGITVEPIEFWKGSAVSDTLRVEIMGFGREAIRFPMMDEQVRRIEPDLVAIFFLSREGGFKDLDTGIQTMSWELILPSDRSEDVRAVIDQSTTNRER